METGKIFRIINKLEPDKVYFGQTSRNIDDRFSEICYDKRATSFIHNEIVKLGVYNFKIELIEDNIPLDKLDSILIDYLISENPYYNFYDIDLNNSSKIFIKGTNLFIKDIDSFLTLASELMSWSKQGISLLFTDTNNIEYSPYRFIPIFNNDKISSIDEIEDWIKTLNKRFYGKHIYCPEQRQHYINIAQAAASLSNQNHIVFEKNYNLISKSLKQKEVDFDNLENLHFFYMPGTINIDFEDGEIYCPEIGKIFNNLEEIISYFYANIFSSMKKKTIKEKILNVLSGIYESYKGYHFIQLDNNLL